MLFVNPEKKSSFHIKDNWTEKAKNAHIKMLKSKGFLECEIIDPATSREEKFLSSSVKSQLEPKEVNGEKVGYVCKLVRFYRPIKLSRDALLGHSTFIMLFENGKIEDDEVLSDWWFNDLTFQKNSEKSKDIAKRLGITDEQFERIALFSNNERFNPLPQHGAIMAKKDK